VKSKQILDYQWTAARNRAGFVGEKWRGVGPHRLRSVWTTEASKRKLDPILIEHQMGHEQHGSSDPYQTAQDDEAFVLQEFRTAWANGIKQAASKEELNGVRKVVEDRDAQIQQLQAQIDGLEKKLGQSREAAHAMMTEIVQELAKAKKRKR
jgi:2C-methyl-D-erythritol 2,4-cyclodiphosphate synthase